MLFKESFFLSLRLRMLLALIAAAGAGIYLTYSAARRVVEPLAAEESGERVFAGLKASASAIDAEVASGLDRARLIAARQGLREILYRRNRGESTGSDSETARLRLGEAARATAGLTALTLADAKGNIVGSFEAARGEGVTRETGGISVDPDEGYVSPPLIEKAALFYEVAVAVPPPGKGAREPAGTLRCRFTATNVLRESPFSFGGTYDFTLARRRGKGLIITSKEKPREEVPLESDKVAPFRPALQGKEGYSTAPDSGGRGVYAYSRLLSADWLIATQTHGPTAPLLYTSSILGKIRLQAWFCFVLLTITSFLAVKILVAPVTENARLAAALLQECGVRDAAAPHRYAEAELISSALTEAGALIKQRAEHGRLLQTETEKLREEETELKYQNLELEKLNKYLLDRETKISELKEELNELKGKITSSTTE